MGDIVILAAQLGMQWSDFKNPLADGGGYSLRSTRVQALGNVLRFSFDTKKATRFQEKEFRRLIPTDAANKLLCGIIPGDQTLNLDDEYPVIGDDRKPSLLDKVISKFDVADDIRKELIRREILDDVPHCDLRYRVQISDLPSLLCPFLPLPDHTSIVGISVPFCFARRPFPALHTPFHFWEGKKKLLDRFREHKRKQGDAHKDLNTLSQHWETMVSYHDDFFCYWDTANITAQVNEPQFGLPGTDSTDKIQKIEDRRERKRNMLKTLSQIHADATSQLVKFPVAYESLVGAHLTLSNQACKDFGATWDQKKLRGKFPHESLGEERGPGIVDEFLEIGDNYGRLASTVFVREVRSRAGDGLKEGSDESIQNIWWAMAVRAVAWHMSVRCFASEDRIPASMYENQAPVWIT